MAFDAGSIEVRYGLKKDAGSFREYKDALGDALRQADKTAAQTRQQKAGIGVDRGSFRDLGRALDGAHNHARRVSRGINTGLKVGITGLAALGTAAAGAGLKMIQLASDAEEAESKFKIVFGKTAPAAVKELDKFNKATGISRYELRKQAADLQALIKPMGLAEKRSADMSVELTKLATDMASFNNVPVDEALTALRAGLVGESEPLRRFQVQLSAARIEQEAMAQGVKKAYNEMSAAEKVQAAYAIILKDSALAQGDAVRTAGSYANQMKRLRGAVSDVGTDLGRALLPSATRIVESLNKNFQAAQPQIQAFADRVAKIMEGDGSVGQKLGRVWQEFQATGAPDKIRDLLIKAIAEAAQAGIKTLIAIWNNTGTWGKLVIGSIIAAKLAPVATGFAKLLTATIGGVGGRGRIGGKGLPGGVMPVYVTNWGGAGGAGGGAGGVVGGMTKGARLMRGLGIIGTVVTVNEVLNEFGLPNSRTIGAMLAKRLYGDAEKITSGSDRMAAAGRRIRGAGEGSYFRTQAGLNREVRAVFAASVQDDKKSNTMAVLKNIMAMEQRGKIAAGSTKRALDSLGPSVAMLGIRMPKAYGHAAKSAEKMERQTAGALGRMRGQYADTASAAERSASRITAAQARIAMAAIRKVGRRVTRAIQGLFASGGYIDGPRGAGVPVMVHGDEAILNADQMELVGRDRVMAALAATGAPTLRAGGGFARGAKPAKGKKPAPKKPAKKPAGEFVVPGSQSFRDRLYGLELARSNAERTEGTADDLRALNAMIDAYRRRENTLNRLIKQYPTRSQRWRAVQDERTSNSSTLTALLGELKQFGAGNEATTSFDQAIEDARTELSLEGEGANKGGIISRLKAAIDGAISELKGRWQKATGATRSSIGSAIQNLVAERSGLSDQVTQAVNPITAFMSAREDLYSQFGGNARALPAGMAFAGAAAAPMRSSGTSVTQNITIAEPPRDAHAFSKALAFEIRGAL